MAIYATIFYFVWYEGFTVNGEKLIGYIILAMLLLGTGFYFNNARKSLGDETTSDIDIDNQFESIRELNVQWVPSFLPKMYNVDANGKPLFQIEPSKRRPITRKLTFIKLFSEGFVIPATYDILDMYEERLASFSIWNNGNRFVLTFYDKKGKKLGYFEQWLTKSLLKNRGTLFHENDTIWRELVANNMSGDIDVKDDQEKVTATYRYGIFPYALNPAFQAEALQSHIRFGSHISDKEKIAYTMIFFFWLKK